MKHAVISASDSAVKECLHGEMLKKPVPGKNAMEKSCCDNQSQQCKSCNHCLHITTATILPAHFLVSMFSFANERFLESPLSLNGIAPNHLLRPPQI